MTTVTSVDGENEQGGGHGDGGKAGPAAQVAGHEESRQDRNPEQDVLELLRSCNNSDKPQLLDLANDIPSLSTTFQNMKSLNLSNTGLSSLPDNFAEAFPRLSILFLSNNNFVQVPAVIGKCCKLQMVAFKSNKCLTSIHPEALQAQLRWLILTDNQITHLPSTIGRCVSLQKLMLSGNCLETLPDEIANCKNLQLVRLASNQLQHCDASKYLHLLLQLPKLAWVGLSDNPFLNNIDSASQQPPIVVLHDLDESLLVSAEVLGRGAGGVTYKLENYQHRHHGGDGGQETTTTTMTVAVKQFASDMTSDGLPSQERSISRQVSQLAGEKKNCTSALIRVVGETRPSACLVMEYLENFKALAGPPSLESCSRDVYPVRQRRQGEGEGVDAAFAWTTSQALQVLSALLNALVELHKIGICHGDFYGHNILIRHDHDNHDDNNDNHDDSIIQARLTDFGAAFNYDTTSTYGKLLPQIELRAYSHLVQEVMDHVVVDELSSHEDDDDDDDGDKKKAVVLQELVAQCRIPGATLDSVYVWLKQEQLKAMARAFDVGERDDDDDGCGKRQ